MKKFTFIFAISLVLFACETENNLFNNKQDLSFDWESIDTNIGIYNGVFTTLDSERRATVKITINNPNSFIAYRDNKARATFTFEDGTILIAKATRSVELGEPIDNLGFIAENMSFTFSADDDGSNSSISNVIYNTKPSVVLIKKHTSKAPVSSITGTFVCVECQDHPGLTVGNTQTFNAVFTASGLNDGSGTITTQIILGTTEYIGTGYQDVADTNGTLETSPVNGFFNAPGNTNVTWSGTHVYNNEVTGDNDCSDFDGNWSWVTINFGTISGTFESTVPSCINETVLVTENFEDPGNISYTANPIDDIIEIADVDYFGIVSLALFQTSDYVYYDNLQGTQFYGAQDTDGTPSGNIDLVTLTWLDIDISTLSTIDVSAYFAEDDDGNNEDWDSGSSVRFEYSFDNSIWSTILAIESTTNSINTAPRIDTDFDGLGDGDEITDVFTKHSAAFSTNNNSTLNVRLIIENINQEDVDIAIDTILIVGY